MRRDRTEWLVPVLLVLLSLVPALAGSVRVAEVVGGAAETAENARFLASPLPVLLHVPAAIVFSMLGAFQFAPALRRRRPRWHRTAGRLLVPCGLVVALSGLWMAHFYPWPAGDGQVVYVERLLVGAAMLAFMLRAVDALRHRDFAAHGAWMTRAYAIALGAGTQVFTHLPWFLLVDGAPGESARAVMLGAGWAINALVAEWVVRRGRVRTRAAVATAA